MARNRLPVPPGSGSSNRNPSCGKDPTIKLMAGWSIYSTMRPALSRPVMAMPTAVLTPPKPELRAERAPDDVAEEVEEIR